MQKKCINLIEFYCKRLIVKERKTFLRALHSNFNCSTGFGFDVEAKYFREYKSCHWIIIFIESCTFYLKRLDDDLILYIIYKIMGRKI